MPTFCVLFISRREPHVLFSSAPDPTGVCMTAQQSVCLSEHVCLCVRALRNTCIREWRRRKKKKVTWSRYITQSKNQFFPYVLRYPGLHSLSHNSGSLFKTPAQCVSVTWCNRARSGDTTLGSDGGGGGWVGVLGSSG